MSESQTGNTTPLERTLVLTVVAAVALAGAGAFVVGGSPTTAAGGAADWSPHPGKEVTPGCSPADGTPDDGPENEPDDSGYQLVINYSEAWQGTIVTNDTNIPIEGTGNETIDIEAEENESVAATVSKANITNETMNVTLLYNGDVVDQQNPVEPTVDNFDDNDDGTSNGGTSTTDSSTSTVGSASDFDSDSSNPDSTSASSSGETSTDDGWNTFGEESQTSSSESSPVAAEDDVFDGTETTTASGDSLDSNDGDTTTSETTDSNDGTETITEECAPVETTTTSTPTETTTTDNTALAVETDEEAQVVMADQDVTGSSLVVESATVPDGGFVVIHDMSMLQGGDAGDSAVEDSVLGVSDELDAQRSEDIEVTLAEDISEDQTLIAVLYRDTDDDGEFEFDAGGEMIDEPYRDDEGAAVGDDAYVTVPGDDTAETAVDADSDTASTQDTAVFDSEEETTTDEPATTTTTTFTSTEHSQAAVSGNAEQTTETNAPGFGIGVAIVALLGVALVATRRS